MKRIVIKLGTQVLIQNTGSLSQPHIQFSQLKSICHELIPLRQKNTQFIIVSSGAVGLGQSHLHLKAPLKTIDKQACASVGQTLLMQNYFKVFQKFNVPIGQVLVTADDFSHRLSFLNLSQTIEKLLLLGVVPIINENDTISTNELKENSYAPSFGDNDKLSALVASKLKADLLILLTTTEGLYNKNPDKDPLAKKIHFIKDIQDFLKIDASGKSVLGRGGMSAKIEASKIASFCGVPTIIASGHKKKTLTKIFKDPFNQTEKRTGTLILPQTRLSEKKQWIAFSSGFKGVLIINDGAKHSLVYKKSSLLPNGLVTIKGHFQEKSIISIQDTYGNEIGRGMASFSSVDIQKYLHNNQTQNLSPSKNNKVIVHRDHMALFINPE